MWKPLQSFLGTLWCHLIKNLLELFQNPFEKLTKAQYNFHITRANFRDHQKLGLDFSFAKIFEEYHHRCLLWFSIHLTSLKLTTLFTQIWKYKKQILLYPRMLEHVYMRPEVNSSMQISFRSVWVLPLFGKLPQWNLHVNCHVSGRTFQSGLRFETGLSLLQVSCKRTLRDIAISQWHLRVDY